MSTSRPVRRATTAGNRSGGINRNGADNPKGVNSGINRNGGISSKDGNGGDKSGLHGKTRPVWFPEPLARGRGRRRDRNASANRSLEGQYR